MIVKHEINVPYRKATFGMGCFWGCDSLFGVMDGVLRTRVGYSGGTTPDPEYRNMGDHTEVIEIDYDPTKISYADLLDKFWNFHEYSLTAPIKRQYMSLILYHDEEQKQLATQSLKEEAAKSSEELITEIIPAGAFYPAEDYHQKYRLQGHSDLVDAIGLTRKLLQTSHVAARLNGYVVGLGGMEQFESDIPKLGLDDKTAEYVREQLRKNEGGMLYC
ncbi:peptide methionine sulfoxide reductase-like [Chrysoperla carnea]|uniref:peptide methionine sulfoxide reductase-like n=1 Tax=Chrysoperla carnea TaxID=189513 RepID=UPI001D06251E|nr:peptide methionine sulfoxide reductase-like [Chrysoperla carnea]